MVRSNHNILIPKATRFSNLFRPLFTLGACVVCLGAGDLTHAAKSSYGAYERYLKPPAYSTSEKALFDAATDWGSQNSKTYNVDHRLSHAATILLRSLHNEPKIDLLQARELAQRFGFTDGQLAAIALQAPNDTALKTMLTTQLQNELKTTELNRIGAATKPIKGGVSAVVLFSKRLVDILPLPARFKRQTRVHLRGVVAQTTKTTVMFAATFPDGTTQKQRLGSGANFEVEFSTGDKVGVLALQILIDRGRGPEIAAQFPIGIETSPFVVGEDELPEDHRPIDSAADAEVRIRQFILGGRQALRLSTPEDSALLANVARAHAEDMRDNGFFAHVSPSTGDLPRRLQVRKVSYRRAVENLALADSAEEIFQQWMASPAHRANVLDPQVTAFGVGAALLRAASGTHIYAVLIMAHLDGNQTITRLQISP